VAAGRAARAVLADGGRVEPGRAESGRVDAGFGGTGFGGAGLAAGAPAGLPTPSAADVSAARAAGLARLRVMPITMASRRSGWAMRASADGGRGLVGRSGAGGVWRAAGIRG
jgi:hypothetical protein